MRVAIYARVSTRHHDQKPEVQIEELRRYCSARGWEISNEIIDHGYSGSTDVRPGLKQLMTLVRERQIDGVAVLKLDRLFRSLKHLVTSLEEFSGLGVTFVAVKDHVDYSTPAGRLFVQVLGALAEFEKSLLVERTLLGLEHARRKGTTLGRPRHNREGEIRMLRQQGFKQNEIANRLGLSKGAVYRALKSS
ncbi:MAG: recombinase family protein [Proteobacteria bacterium]|nr:MAG: recombinase family protein [Pseudomonadota bacterium]